MSYGFDMGFAQANSLQEAMAIALEYTQSQIRRKPLLSAYQPTVETVGFPGLHFVKIQAGSLYPEKAKSSWEQRNKKSPLIFGWAAFFACQNVRTV